MNGKWSQVQLGGKIADVYELPKKETPRFGILFLHPVGLETLADNHTYTKLFDELRLVCVCPHTQRSWWTDRTCAEFDHHLTAEKHILENIVPYFGDHWNLKPGAIGLIGISMGGQGALRLGFRHPKVFPVIAGISSAIEYQELYGQGSPLDDMYDSKEQCRQDTAIMHVPPYNGPPHIYFCIDPADVDWHRGNDRLHEKMGALGLAHTCDLTTQAGGHSWDYFNAMADPTIRFVYEGLDQQSRRLL
ncbi:MAG: alpha/beta hydrolase-fold protein [Gemmataceae bacterium]